MADEIGIRHDRLGRFPDEVELPVLIDPAEACPEISMTALGIDRDMPLRCVEFAMQHDRPENVRIHRVYLRKRFSKYMHLKIRSFYA